MATGSLRKYREDAKAIADADYAGAKRAHDEKTEHQHFYDARYIKDEDSYRGGVFKADTFSDEELDSLKDSLKSKIGKIKRGGGDDPTEHDDSILESLEYVLERIRDSKMESEVKESIKAEQAARAKRRGEAV